MDQVFVLSAIRTPIGSLNGSLSHKTAPELGAVVIKGALEKAHILPAYVEEVIMGNVITAGVGQAPARQAAIFAGIPPRVGATTINKVCGSGMKAVMLGAQSILVGDSQVVVAGGMESMSRAPYLLEKARMGYRYGHAELVDSVIKDGLWDVYNRIHMGQCGEMCAEKYGISREAQDEYAVLSYQRAQKAQQDGAFAQEIVPVDSILEDEEPKKTDFSKFPKLKPVFKNPGGTITPANASKINDGASALVLSSESKTKQMGLRPKARILGWATYSQEPEWFTTAPVGAIQKLLQKLGMAVKDFDLFEVNEAFAAVALAVIQLANLPKDRTNAHGGAVALGHPIGCSGARILTTLLNALEIRNLTRGLAAVCLGGGEATAMAIEKV